MKRLVVIMKKVTGLLCVTYFLFTCGSPAYPAGSTSKNDQTPVVIYSQNNVPNATFMEYVLLERDDWRLRFRQWRSLKRMYCARMPASTSALTETEEERKPSFSLPPNDPYYEYQWGLQKINAEKAWEISTGEGIVVAVLDTGIDYNHSDISSQLWYNEAETPGDGIDNDLNGFIDDYLGWDFAGTNWYYNREDNDVLDRNGHGTHVAGIIAAEGNNSEGIIGVAPLARILPVKVLDDSGRGSWSSVARGIRYAADMGARVINLSLGGWGYASSRSLLGMAVNYAASKGCVIVAAAGNSNYNVDNFLPANMSDVIAVAATTGLNDGRAHFSNYGSCLDVAAPGVNVLSLRAAGTGYSSTNRGYDFFPRLDPQARYRKLNGTSMAAPFVSGLAALLLADNPLLEPNDVRRIIRFSAEDLGSAGFDPYFGYGRIDAYSALVYSSTGSLESVSGGSGTDGALGASSIDLGEEDPEEETAVSIKGEDVNEVVSMYEVQRKNRAGFTGYSPVEDTHPDHITLE